MALSLPLFHNSTWIYTMQLCRLPLKVKYGHRKKRKTKFANTSNFKSYEYLDKMLK